MGSRAGTGTGIGRKQAGQDELSHLIWNLDEEPDTEYDNLNTTGQMFNMHQKAVCIVGLLHFIC
jgi:hypothetical protein